MLNSHQLVNSSSRQIIPTGQLNKSMRGKCLMTDSVTSIHSALNTGKDNHQYFARSVLNTSQPIQFTYKVKTLDGETKNAQKKIIMGQSVKTIENRKNVNVDPIASLFSTYRNSTVPTTNINI
jgi:hypothetical protein